MQTQTEVSPLEAAKLTGKSKATINRALKDGDLSGRRDTETGRWFIEPAELFRVFQASGTPHEPAHKVDHEPPQAGSSLGEIAKNELAHGVAEGGSRAGSQFDRLRAELAAMTERLETQKHERERERIDHLDTIRDLRARLDSSEEERRKATTQLTALLTDQTKKAEASAAEPPRRGLFGFLRGRKSA